MFQDPQTLYIGLICLATLAGFAGFFWKSAWWLSDKFKDMTDTVNNWMDSHEEKDQHRHEDNLERFTKIETKLDIVLKNGHN